MEEAKGGRRIQSVLFVCARNSVRSPMAEALARHYFGKSVYCQSAGVRPGEPDPFMVAALDEIGIDASKHKPRTLAAEVEYWPTADPTIVQGSREQVLDAYRDVRDGLSYRIRKRLKE